MKKKQLKYPERKFFWRHVDGITQILGFLGSDIEFKKEKWEIVPPTHKAPILTKFKYVKIKTTIFFKPKDEKFRRDFERAFRSSSGVRKFKQKQTESYDSKK